MRPQRQVGYDANAGGVRRPPPQRDRAGVIMVEERWLDELHHLVVDTRANAHKRGWGGDRGRGWAGQAPCRAPGQAPGQAPRKSKGNSKGKPSGTSGRDAAGPDASLRDELLRAERRAAEAEHDEACRPLGSRPWTRDPAHLTDEQYGLWSVCARAMEDAR
jgi:hypothetical protein